MLFRREMLRDMGRYMILGGVVLLVMGAVFMFAEKLPFIGRLPGDISIKKGSFAFYFPVTTCILASIVLSVVMYLISRK
jgi:hypothetical protein